MLKNNNRNIKIHLILIRIGFVYDSVLIIIILYNFRETDIQNNIELVKFIDFSKMAIGTRRCRHFHNERIAVLLFLFLLLKIIYKTIFKLKSYDLL